MLFQDYLSYSFEPSANKYAAVRIGHLLDAPSSVECTVKQAQNPNVEFKYGVTPGTVTDYQLVPLIAKPFVCTRFHIFTNLLGEII